MEINLIRRAAWSFQKTTGLPYEDLFSEASLHYAIAETKWDGKSCKFTTYAFKLMRNGLIDYCARQRTPIASSFDIDMIEAPASVEQTILFVDSLTKTNENIRIVYSIIFNAPEEYASISPKLSRGLIVEKLRELGWSWSRIWDTIRELKSVLKLGGATA